MHGGGCNTDTTTRYDKKVEDMDGGKRNVKGRCVVTKECKDKRQRKEYMDKCKKERQVGVSTVPYTVYGRITQTVRRSRYACIRIRTVVPRSLDGTGRCEYGRKRDLTGSYGFDFNKLCISTTKNSYSKAITLRRASTQGAATEGRA